MEKIWMDPIGWGWSEAPVGRRRGKEGYPDVQAVSDQPIGHLGHGLSPPSERRPLSISQ